MLPIPADIFTEPEDVSHDGLAMVAPPRLNPLAVIVNDRAEADEKSKGRAV